MDDNDLEPMFEPTEYNIELNKYTFWPETGKIGRSQRAQFTSIGRVLASDPDSGANALTRYFLTTVHPLFGMNWQTGQVYLKRSLSDTFDALNTTETVEIEIEAKTVDGGLKYAAVNGLTRLNPSTSLAENDLVLAASQLHLNSTLIQHLPHLATFETAQLRIRLNNNLADLYADIFDDAQLIDINSTSHIISVCSYRLPVKILHVTFKNDRFLAIDVKKHLRISNPSLEITQLDARSFLITFDADSQAGGYVDQVRVEFCAVSTVAQEVCHQLAEFVFNATSAVLDALERTCSSELKRFDQTGHSIQLNRFSSVQNVVRIGVQLQPAYCRRMLTTFFSSNDSNVSIDDRTGLVSLSGEAARSTADYLIFSVFYYQNQRLNLQQSNNFVLAVQYSKRYSIFTFYFASNKIQNFHVFIG